MLNIPRIKQRVKYLYRAASPFDWIIAAGEMLRQAQHNVLFFSAQRQLLLLLLLFAASVSPAIAQVANDNIENRCVLQTGETVTSSTTDCTVQRSCVDERLTGKCIEYHNDQWFEFTPKTSGRYFVNIGGQKCRDVRGVQLVVLTGEPCRPTTYRVLSCTSLGTQDDVFVTLDSLRAGQPYLLDVDGYLKDFCQFALQVSDRAVGMPAVPPPASLAGALPGSNRIIHLEWTLPDSLAATARCRVLRRELREFRSSERARVPVGHNTLGGKPATYIATDTLPHPGYYRYQIVADAGPDGQPPALLRQQWVSFSQLNPLLDHPPAAPHVVLPLNKYPRNARLSVVISNPANGQVLLARQLVSKPGDKSQGWLPVSKWQDAGLEKIEVEINCHPPHGDFFVDRLLLSLPTPDGAAVNLLFAPVGARFSPLFLITPSHGHARPHRAGTLPGYAMARSRPAGRYQRDG